MNTEDSRNTQAGGCTHCETEKPSPKDREASQDEAIARNMARIGHKILVLSGKGGVGKSTVAVNVAATLAREGKRVGLMDIDIHGPSVAHLVKVRTKPAGGANGRMQPALTADGIKVMSIGYMLQDAEEAVIWRGPMKHGVIRQFLAEVEWGDLDYLVVDSPPGTGDEPLSIAQSIKGADGAVIVTTPQEVALEDVRRSIGFCRKLELPVLGVVENMSGFVCPHCGETSDIFKRGGGANMAEQMQVPYLGGIPIDPTVVLACDAGTPFVQKYEGSQTSKAFQQVVQPLLQLKKPQQKPQQVPLTKPNKPQSQPLQSKPGKETMKIVIPIVEGRLSPHFGHCETFACIDVDKEKKQIIAREDLEAPPHEPGLLPKWLHERGAKVIFAGGMGSRAQALFSENGIAVLTGVPSEKPEELIEAWFRGKLKLGDNVCDH